MSCDDGAHMWLSIKPVENTLNAGQPVFVAHFPWTLVYFRLRLHVYSRPFIAMSDKCWGRNLTARGGGRQDRIFMSLFKVKSCESHVERKSAGIQTWPSASLFSVYGAASCKITARKTKK